MNARKTDASPASFSRAVDTARAKSAARDGERLRPLSMAEEEAFGDRSLGGGATSRRSYRLGANYAFMEVIAGRVKRVRRFNQSSHVVGASLGLMVVLVIIYLRV